MIIRSNSELQINLAPGNFAKGKNRINISYRSIEFSALGVEFDVQTVEEFQVKLKMIGLNSKIVYLGKNKATQNPYKNLSDIFERYLNTTNDLNTFLTFNIQALQNIKNNNKSENILTQHEILVSLKYTKLNADLNSKREYLHSTIKKYYREGYFKYTKMILNPR